MAKSASDECASTYREGQGARNISETTFPENDEGCDEPGKQGEVGNCDLPASACDAGGGVGIFGGCVTESWSLEVASQTPPSANLGGGSQEFGRIAGIRSCLRCRSVLNDAPDRDDTSRDVTGVGAVEEKLQESRLRCDEAGRPPHHTGCDAVELQANSCDADPRQVEQPRGGGNPRGSLQDDL